MKVIASHNTDTDIRSSSSSGGIFSILAEDVLLRGGVVYGVGFDSEWGVEYKRITAPADLPVIRGSKYVFASIGPVMGMIDRDLADGREVIVSGSPCQIGAVRHRHDDNPRLLLVEIICHSAPEPRFWKKYLSEICKKRRHSIEDITDISFRNKRLGWKVFSLAVNFKNGKDFSERYDDNLYLRAFFFGYTVRPSCFNCKFKYPDGTKADLSLGDFWGITELAPKIDNDLGTSLIIARTEKGEKAVENLTVDTMVDINDATKYNPAIFKGAKKPKRFDEFRKVSDQSDRLIPVLKKFVARPLFKQLYLDVARFKYRVIKKFYRNKK